MLNYCLFIVENAAMIILSVLITFFLIVVIIGLATAKLNAKGPCDHHWVETEEGNIRCTRCYRTIRHEHDMSERELGVTLLKSQDDSGKPVRADGVKISAQVLKDAS